jgi:predicted enzyme related to lactoylglutathione lyase
VDTNQPDPAAGVEFYSRLFGWTFQDLMPPGSGRHYFIALLHGGVVAGLASPSESAPERATWDTYVSVDSADETATKVRAAGGSVVKEPFDIMDAGRMAIFADPEGATFCVWQAKAFAGAQVVNEPGSLNFNGLNTRDVEGAKAFYGSVFGWDTLSAGGAEMWTLPGYGDHLERDDPDLRKRVAEVGGPVGFEDVVASISPIADERIGVPPHWNVTFAVADADAVAKTAAELGGEVVVAPFDAPWVRMTVITDPQGATFIASKFVLENKDIGSQADAVGAR